MKRLAASLSLAVALTGCVGARLGHQVLAPVKIAAPATVTSTAAAIAPTPMAELPQARPIDESKPVKLRADKLRYDDRIQETRFTGHVVAKQETTTLYADRLVTRTEGQSAAVSGHVRLLDDSRRVELLAAQGDYSGAMSVANFQGGVVLHSIDPYAVSVTVTGESGSYQALSRYATVEGGIRVLRGRLTATAKSAELSGTDLLTLKGGVTVLMGVNRIEAERAFMNGKDKSIRFEDQVRAHVIPAELREAAAHPERE